MSSKTKNKKGIVPKLRFPEFRSKESWQPKKLSDLLFETKQRNKALDYNPNDVLSVSGEYGCVNQIEHLGRSYAGVSVANYHIVEKGDIVYTKSPLKRSPFGIIKENKGKVGIVSTLYAVYRTTALASPSYLDHYFSVGYNLNSYLQPLVRKGAKNDMKVNNYAVLGGEIWVPKKEEQQKIADCLSSLDELIDAEDVKLEALQQHKNGLMQELFPAKGETLPKRRFPEFKDAPEWKEIQLREVSEPVLERAKGNTQAMVLTLSAEYGLVHQGEYFGKKIAGENVERYIKIAHNDFVYNDRTTKAFTYGTIKRLSKHPSGIVSPIYKCFRFNKHENPIFWEWYFESGAHEPILHNLINEGARAGRFNISIDKFLSTVARRPKQDEQKRIADFLSSIDDLIAAQSQKLDALRNHKKGLMQQLFPTISEVQE